MFIAREAINPDADKVVRRLRRYNHKAYLVGGCVRDLLLGRTPKDFDVATSATPSEIKELFRNCRIIGRRFRLAHVFFGDRVIETSTFRSDPREGKDPGEVEELLIRRDNVFGTVEEDARRRDFTINGLFYDLEAGEVLDYVGGLADLDAHVIRTIGDPEIRFREDPVRILRAVKFAARLGFSIDPATYAALLRHKDEIHACSPPRVLEEVYRLLRGEAARRSMELLLETGVGRTVAPELVYLFGGVQGEDRVPIDLPCARDDDELQLRRKQAWQMLEELDGLASAPQDEALITTPPSNALLLASLTASFVLVEQVGSEPLPPAAENVLAIEKVLRPLCTRLGVSRRDLEQTRQILMAQRRLLPARRRRSRPMTLIKRDWFPEALLIYEMMARVRGKPADEADHFRQLLRRRIPEAHADATLPAEVPVQGTKRRRRRKRGGRRRRRAEAADLLSVTGLDSGSDVKSGAAV